MVQQALKNNGSEIGDLMKLAHNSLYLWDQWTLCYERMLHMTPRTFSVNTGAAALFTLNVALRMLQRRLPTYFSGVSLWKSLALVQRPIACSATSCAEGCVFQNYTLCLFQHFAHGKTNSNPSACSAAQTLVQRYTPWTSVHWWMDLVFPPAHGPGRGQRRSTWAPKHIKITHPLATLLKSKWYECRMVQPSNSCDFDTWYLLLEPCHKERSCWRHTPPNIMQTPLKEVGMITTRFKKNNTAQTKMSFLMCLDLSASSLSCSPWRAALGTEAVPFHSELGLVWDWLGWLGSLFEWKMIPFNLYSFGAYFPNILGWDWLGWFGIFICNPELKILPVSTLAGPTSQTSWAEIG